MFKFERKGTNKKVLFGLAISLVLAMAIGSFALSEAQTPTTPTTPRASEPRSVVATYGDFNVYTTVGSAPEFDAENGVLKINGGSHEISMVEAGKSTNQRIEVANAETTITLNGVNISTSYGPALKIADDAAFDVTITLADDSTNILETTKAGCAGLQKNGNDTGKLTIGAGDIGNGQLTATGGDGGAGIGGGTGGIASNIEISGGKVTANGASGGAGIGAGFNQGGSNITISGGEVTAYGFEGGAGIGGGMYGTGSNITISGGVVTAYGFEGIAAGIGGGDRVSEDSSNNILDGGVVVLATNVSSSESALEGFDGNLTKGIVFTGVGEWDYDDEKPIITWDENGTMYTDEGNPAVAITQDVEFPANLTVGNDAEQRLVVNTGVTLTIPAGPTEETKVTLTNGKQGSIENNGFIDCQGKIKTVVGYETDGGSAVTDGTFTYRDDNETKKYDTLPTPAKEGYTLDGWYTEAGGQGTNVTEDSDVDPNQHTLYANWAANDYNVTIETLTGGTITSDTSTAQYGGTVTLTVTPDIGYSLVDGSLTVMGDSTGDSVEVSGSGETYTFDMPAEDVTVSAEFEANDYNVTIETLTGGTITSDPSGTAKTDATVTLTVTPNTGYSFVDGSLRVKTGSENVPTTKGEDDKYTFTMPAEDVTVSATFEKNSYEVTIDKQNGSEPEKQTVLYGDTVTKPADPTRDGYSFVDWYTNAYGTGNPYDFSAPVESSFTIYAKWLGDEHHVVVPTEADEHGKITTDPEDPRTGDTVILTATPDEGYQVKGLPKVKILRQNEKLLAAKSGNDIGGIDVTPIGNNQYSFVMPNGNVEISAEFEAIPDPTPTPPTPTPEPTPTPDPSVDPDGGSGGGASSKTGDPFACGAALALLGIATTGAILTRKRK